jgi:hypothetical protein
MSTEDFKQMIKDIKSFKNNPILSKIDLACGIELLIWGSL